MKKDRAVYYGIWLLGAIVYLLSVICLVVRELPQLAIVVGVSGVVVFSFFLKEIRTGLSFKGMMILIVSVIMLQGIFYVRFSQIDYRRYIGPSFYVTRYDYFEKKYHDTPMTFVEFRSFSLTDGYDYFWNKDVYIDDRLEDDEIIGYLLRGLNDRLKLVHNMQFSFDNVENDNLFMEFYSEVGEEVHRNLYLAKIDGSEEDSKVAIYKNGDDIYIVEGADVSGDDSIREVTNWINADSISRYDTVKVYWGNDKLFASRSEKTLGRSNIVAKIFLAGLLIYAVGLIAGLHFRRVIGNITCSFMAFLLGTILLIIGNVLLGVIGVKFTATTVIVTWIAIAAIINIASWFAFRKIKLAKESDGIMSLIVCSIISVVIIAIFSIIPNVTMSYDSMMYNYLARYIVNHGEMTSNMGELSSFTLATPVINILPTVMGIDLFYAFQPAHTVIGLLAIGYIQSKLFNKFEISKGVMIAIAVISMLLYYTTPEMWAFSDWINNNILIAVWLGLAVALIMFVNKQNNATILQQVWMIAPFFVMGNIVRIEGMLYGAILLVMLYVCGYDKRLVKNLGILSSVVLSLEFIWFYSILGNTDSKFWTAGKGAMVLVLLLGVTVVLCLDKLLANKLKWLYDYMDIIMIGGLALGGALLLVLNLKLGISNIFSLAMQWFVQGFYGNFVIMIVVLLVAGRSYIRDNRKLYRFVIGFVLASILMTYDLCFFRSPLHYGAGDSACRMTMQMFPIIGIMVNDIIVRKYLDNKNKQSV